MDNVTHTLVGLTLARTRLGRAGRGTTMALVLASNAPDIDIVTTAGGASSYLHWHRGPTHGPLGIICLGLATAAIVWFSREKFDKNTAAPRASFVQLALICMLGVFVHILMDLPTSYGTRPLSPFSWHWYAEDWLPIVDIYLLAVLAAGLFFGRGSELARRQNVAIVFTLMLFDYGLRGVAHHEAITLAPRVFGPTLPAACVGAPSPYAPLESWPRPAAISPGDTSRRCLVDLAATPDALSPFEWRLIAQTSNSYETFTINLLDKRYREPVPEHEVLYRRALRYANVWTPAVFESAQAPKTNLFLGFSRFPLARTSPSGAEGDTTVRWSDIRFSTSRPPTPVVAGARPDRGIAASAGNLFGVTDTVAPDGRVIEELFGR
jgi:inner membrane protein